MIFISYNRRHDAEVANRIAAILQAYGFSVWQDAIHIRAGERFETSITEAIRSASLFIGVLSSEACASSHVEKEWSLAGGRRDPLVILPVLVRGLQSDQLRGTFEYHGKFRQHLNCDRLDAHFERRLIESVRVLLPAAEGDSSSTGVTTGPAHAVRSGSGVRASLATLAVVGTGLVIAAVLWLRLPGAGLRPADAEVQAPLETRESVSAASGGQVDLESRATPVLQLPPVQGMWEFTTSVEASRYNPYVGLVSVYRISLYRLPDGRVRGNGELWSEAGEEVVGRNHLPIAFEGAQDGEVLHLTFRVESTSRPVTGGAEFRWDRSGGRWSGTFYSGAGASTGAAALSAR